MIMKIFTGDLATKPNISAGINKKFKENWFCQYTIAWFVIQPCSISCVFAGNDSSAGLAMESIVAIQIIS